ncbi:type VII secretion target [Aestuariimicrobium ganziense]|uniref:type VII secretion target n=1 Tax=Aestuariimicrobium ganziense TaxID=2773677 RepID=UPI001944E66E|nr:type VII secretion target [Aestuariimicrobium ganziense]
MTISVETEKLQALGKKLTDEATMFNDTVKPLIEQAEMGWQEWPLLGLGTRGAVEGAREQLLDAVTAMATCFSKLGESITAAGKLYQTYEEQQG